MTVRPALAALLLGVTAAAGAQPFPRGEVVPRVASRADSTQSYALYLPSTYAPDRPAPVLFAMDPRGRALVPMELARPAAERLGWIVLSSYDTRSDVAVSPNGRALEAMLADAQRLLAVAPGRMYLAGFSGTAREGWAFALAMKGHAAGLIGFGAGFPNPATILGLNVDGGAPFVFYGGAGNVDFNFEEMRQMDAALENAGMPRRMVYWPGEHGWAPEPLFADAMEWMELKAVERGIARRDSAWVDALLARRTAEARAVDEAGRPADALPLWTSVADDFGALRDVSAARARADALARLPAVRRAHAARDRAAAEYMEHLRTLSTVRGELEGTAPLPDHARLLRRLRVAEITRDTAAADTFRARYAQRLVAHLLSLTASYAPRAVLERGDADRALAILRVAAEVRPNSPGICYSMARAHALAGRPDDAFAALDCASAGRLTADLVEGDEMFAPLRSDARYAALLDRLRRR
jgi:predicted esterase